MEYANKSQSIIVVESLDVPLPDALAPTLHEVFPGFEIMAEDTLGDPIPDATYRQRLACHYLTPYAMYDKDRCERIINQNPMVYDPDEFDYLGRPIPIEQENVGKLFYVISIIKVRGIREDLISLFNARKAITGTEFKYPNGFDIPEVELSAYLKFQDKTV